MWNCRPRSFKRPFSIFWFKDYAYKRTWIPILIAISMVIRVSANTDYYEFPFYKDTSLPESVSYPANTVLGVPAGKHGWLEYKKNKLVFQDGTPAKFWGVNLTFSGGRNTLVPPNKEEATQLVLMLSQLGINHVRLVGLDLTAPEIALGWLNKRSRHSETLDKLNYFIYLLRTSGIYYSFSINNSSKIILDRVDGAIHGMRQGIRKYKEVKLFDDKSISAVVGWYKYFFSLVNPYTGLTYAEDPANIYLAAVNEDSIFHSYFENFKSLGDNAIEVLTEKYVSYLRGKYQSTSALRKAWDEPGLIGLQHKEDLDANLVDLVKYKDRKKYSRKRNYDTLDFLVSIGKHFGESIKAAVQGLGYKGLFTYTQGVELGTQFINDGLSSYLEMHGYFDHPNKIRGSVAIHNLSYLRFNPRIFEKTNLFRAFYSAQPGLPYFITEWNHSSWSDYSYEGPILQVTYSMLQGYSGLDAFTFFSHPNPNPDISYAKTPLVVFGNGVLTALMPSLSRIFLNGYITEGKKEYVVTKSASINELYDRLMGAGVRLGEINGPCDYLALGFVHKLRTKLVGDQTTLCNHGKDNGVFVSDTHEIKWQYGGAQSPTIIVNSDYAKILAGQDTNTTEEFGALGLRLQDHGAVVVVPLDGKRIWESGQLLLTIVQSSRNSGIKEYDIPFYRVVSMTGAAPILMKHIRAHLYLNPGFYTKVYAVLLNGKKLLLEPENMSNMENGEGLDYIVGREDTPWYVIEK